MDSRFSPSESPGRWRKPLSLLVMLLLSVAAGIWIGRTSAPDVNPSPSEPGSGTSPVAREVVNGVPLGYERTEQGAVEAATNFARVMASASGDPDAYRAGWRTMAAPDWRQRAEELAENGLEFLQERYGTGGSFTFSPVRYRVSAYSRSAATVGLWGVTVASGPKVPGIEESWLTATIELTWVSGDWRVSGQSSETGPTPELLRAEDARTAGSLEGFKEYERAPAP